MKNKIVKSVEPSKPIHRFNDSTIQRFNDSTPDLMNYLKQTIASLSAFLIGAVAFGQDVPADRVSVPFRDPSRPGMVKVNLMNGGISVNGYDGKEVVVEARLRGVKTSNKKASGGKSEGLKRIEIATTGLTVEEEDNVVSVSTGSMGRTVDLSLQVPAATSLKLGCVNDRSEEHTSELQS